MIICDNCERIIEHGERCGIQTRADPYGEVGDWCMDCHNTINEMVSALSIRAKKKLQRDITDVMKKMSGNCNENGK